MTVSARSMSWRTGYPGSTGRSSGRTSSTPSSLHNATSTYEGFTSHLASVANYQSKQIDVADGSSKLPEKFI